MSFLKWMAERAEQIPHESDEEEGPKKPSKSFPVHIHAHDDTDEGEDEHPAHKPFSKGKKPFGGSQDHEKPFGKKPNFGHEDEPSGKPSPFGHGDEDHGKPAFGKKPSPFGHGDEDHGKPAFGKKPSPFGGDEHDDDPFGDLGDAAPGKGADSKTANVPHTDIDRWLKSVDGLAKELTDLKGAKAKAADKMSKIDKKYNPDKPSGKKDKKKDKGGDIHLHLHPAKKDPLENDPDELDLGGDESDDMGGDDSFHAPAKPKSNPFMSHKSKPAPDFDDSDDSDSDEEIE